MSDSWEEEPQGHDWKFDRYTKTYYCTRCNLQNSNGADGSIVLEDASEMDNDADTLIVGYWNKDDIKFILNITLVLHTPESDGNDQILISGVKFKYSKEGSYVTFSRAEVEVLAKRLGYTPDQYDIRISFVPVGFESDLDYAITFN
jgi:hypothetical protein